MEVAVHKSFQSDVDAQLRREFGVNTYKAIVEESQITLNAGLLGGGLVTRRKNSVARTKN